MSFRGRRHQCPPPGQCQLRFANEQNLHLQADNSHSNGAVASFPHPPNRARIVSLQTPFPVAMHWRSPLTGTRRHSSTSFLFVTPPSPGGSWPTSPTTKVILYLRDVLPSSESSPSSSTSSSILFSATQASGCLPCLRSPMQEAQHYPPPVRSVLVHR